ncbi:MAG TPA: response regulator [Opitutaceae bacterium]|nr:response regulator [Opitutaceae bacterium]
MIPIVSKTVLFLDDERSYVDLMVQLLSENLNCRVIGHTRPHDALAALPQLNAAVIITDYHMPLMNGIEFIHRAHALCPETAAIMITGQPVELADEDLTRVPGLRATLFKPLGWRTLAENIVMYWPDLNPPLLKEDLFPN